jgi:dihydroneopterin aldolase
VTRTYVSVGGIEAMGHHGIDEEERAEAQPFLLDLDVVVEVDRDRLESTVDYRAIVDVARGVVEGASFFLLETMAEAVATGVFGMEGVQEVTATVHKPRAARSMGVGDVTATVSLR